MIHVCKTHVKDGLKLIFLPHIHQLPAEEKMNKRFSCQVCQHQADYKLFNYNPYNSRRFSNVI